MIKKGHPTRRKRLNRETLLVKSSRHEDIAVALVYLNSYHLGMSNLGYQTVFRLLNELDGIVCERFFLPDNNLSNTDGTISIESGRSIATFDVIALSISFENDYPGVLTFLESAHLPLLSKQRDDSHPLIIAGGVTCLLNPAPIGIFMDCILIGEAEAILPEFVQRMPNAESRQEFLLKAAQEIQGVYVPGFYTDTYHADGTFKELVPQKDVPASIKRAYIKDINQIETCSAILTPDTTFGQTYLMEVSRGCAHGCRFCGAGFIYRPPRYRNSQLLSTCMQKGRMHTDKIGLVGAAVSDLPGLNDLCNIAETLDAEVSFSSLRADALDENLINHLAKSGVKTATIAPDAGSERMRRCINKGITEDDILHAAQALVASNIPNLKLYFMIGLPSETLDDIHAITLLCKKVKQVFLASSRPRGRMGNITVSINTFIPKPHTPFQWVPMDDTKALKKKYRIIQQSLKSLANVRLQFDTPRWAYNQALLSRGDWQVAKILLAVHANHGNWPKTLKQSSIDPDFYVTRARHANEIFPWDFINHGISKAFLLAEYHKALRGDTTDACDVDSCRKCGVCGNKKT